MKGLILKDLYCIRFTLILSLVLALAPNILFLLMGGGMTVGLAGTATELLAYIPYGMLNFITIACFGNLTLNTLRYDTESGWSKYQMTLPVGSGDIILSKQISSVVMVMILVLCCYVPNVFAIVFFGASIEIMLAMPLIFGMLELLCLLPSLPTALRFGVKAVNIISTFYLVLMALIIMLAMLMMISVSIPAAVIRLVLYAGLPLLTVAAGYLSDKAAKKLLLVNLEKE